MTKIDIPKSLYDVTLHQSQVFDKIMASDDMSDTQKIVNILANVSDIDIVELSKMPFTELDTYATQIIELFTVDDGRYDTEITRRIKFDEVEYGLEPDFPNMELGAFIDLEKLLNEPGVNLHKIMAVLYRPVVTSAESLYTLSSYSDEDNAIKNEREALFLNHMPYGVVRAVVNFILRHIQE